MCIYHMMSQQNIREYNFKKWYLRPVGQMLDINLASDERDYDEEVIFSNKLIGQDDGNRLPIYFDLNNSGSSQQFNINYGDFISANTLVSLNYYNPNNEDISCFSSNTLCDIGLTGIDNGLVPEMSGESINFTMGLYTGLTKWDRYHYDRRFKMISITGYTQTPINLILDVIVTPGSVVLNYNLFSNLVLSNDVSLTFTTVLGLITGGSVSFMTGVTINSGSNSGNTSVILNENFGDFDRTLIISGVSSTDESMDYIITVNSEFEFATPTPTPTVTPTQTNTPTNTPSNTNTQTQTITPTNTPTNTPTQTQTITPTSSITPSNTNTQTPTNTPTNTPSSSTSGGGIVSDNLFMELEGSDYSGSGQWLDRTVNGNNGTVNGATYLPDYGGVFDFNGINNTISVAHTSNLSLSTTQQRTVQVWVRFDEIPALNAQIPVFGKLSSLSGFDGYWGGLFSNGGVVRVTTNGTGTQKVSDSTLTINSNIWYLFTFISQITSALNTTKVYINETEYISTQHGSDTYNESNPFYLGFIGSGVGSLYLNGKIGACYFYTKGLNTSEISQNYNNTKNKYL